MFYEELNEQQHEDRQNIVRRINTLFVSNLKPIRFGRNRSFNLVKNPRAFVAHTVHGTLHEWYRIVSLQFSAICQEYGEARCYYELHNLHNAGGEITYLVISQKYLENSIVRLCSLVDIIAQVINTRYYYFQNENEINRFKIKEALRLTNKHTLLSIMNELDGEVGKVRQWRNIAVHKGKFQLFPVPKMDVKRSNGRIVGAGFGMQTGIDPNEVYQKVFQTIIKVNAILPKLIRYMEKSITNIR